MVGGLIVANLVVFGLWRLLPPKFMSDNFLVRVPKIFSKIVKKRVGQMHMLLVTLLTTISTQNEIHDLITLHRKHFTFPTTNVAPIHRGTEQIEPYGCQRERVHPSPSHHNPFTLTRMPFAAPFSAFVWHSQDMNET